MFRYDTRCEACLFGQKHGQMEHEEYIFDWYQFNSSTEETTFKPTAEKRSQNIASTTDREQTDQL